MTAGWTSFAPEAGALAVAALLFGSALAASPAGASPPPERRAELMHLLKHDCGSCHGLTLKGGLGPSLLPAAIADKPDDVLAASILHGRPGTPMPPWAFALSDGEAAWLVGVLRRGEADAR